MKCECDGSDTQCGCHVGKACEDDASYYLAKMGEIVQAVCVECLVEIVKKLGGVA